MAGHWAELGLDPDRLERRLRFLLERAAVHDDRGSLLDIACAATLRRDAAAVNLLLGQPNQARPLFGKAGRQLADLGVFAGYSLISLSQPTADTSEFVSQDELGEIEQSLSAYSASEPFAQGSDRMAKLRLSTNSPQQLLKLFQATRRRRHSPTRASKIAEIASLRLSANANVLVATVGIPLPIYLRLYDQLSFGEITPADRSSIMGFSIRRDELMSVARADSYHWRLAQKPADLIDFDLVSLGIAAINAGPKSESLLFDVLGEGGVAAHLPFYVAKELSQLK